METRFACCRPKLISVAHGVVQSSQSSPVFQTSFQFSFTDNLLQCLKSRNVAILDPSFSLFFFSLFCFSSPSFLTVFSFSFFLLLFPPVVPFFPSSFLFFLFLLFLLLSVFHVSFFLLFFLLFFFLFSFLSFSFVFLVFSCFSLFAFLFPCNFLFFSSICH